MKKKEQMGMKSKRSFSGSSQKMKSSRKQKQQAGGTSQGGKPSYLSRIFRKRSNKNAKSEEVESGKQPKHKPEIKEVVLGRQAPIKEHESLSSSNTPSPENIKSSSSEIDTDSAITEDKRTDDAVPGPNATSEEAAVEDNKDGSKSTLKASKSVSFSLPPPPNENDKPTETDVLDTDTNLPTNVDEGVKGETLTEEEEEKIATEKTIDGIEESCQESKVEAVKNEESKEEMHDCEGELVRSNSSGSSGMMGFLLSPFQDQQGTVQFGASGFNLNSDKTLAMHPLASKWQTESENQTIMSSHEQPDSICDSDEEEKDDAPYASLKHTASSSASVTSIEVVDLGSSQSACNGTKLDRASERQLLKYASREIETTSHVDLSEQLLIPIFSDSFDHASVGMAKDNPVEQQTGFFIQMLAPIRETVVDEAYKGAEALYTKATKVDWKEAGGAVESAVNTFFDSVEEVSESVAKNTLLFDVVEGTAEGQEMQAQDPIPEIKGAAASVASF